METRQLNINEVTSSVMNVVGEATNEDRLMFKQWVAECMQELGPSSIQLKKVEIEPVDLSFRKPEDLTATVDLALYDVNGNELFYNFIANSPGRIHVDRFAVNASLIIGTSVATFAKVDLSEDVYYFHLGSNGSNVSKMLLSYMAMPVDRQGFPLIPESNLTAYKMFCRWMWALRQNSNQSFIAQAYDMWLREKDRARGRNKMVDPMRAEQFFKKYMSLVSRPIFNNG